MNMKKVILGILIGLSLSTISVAAISLCNAKNIEYTSKNTIWDVDTLEDALNDLYENYKCSSEYNCYVVSDFEYTGKEAYFYTLCPGKYLLEVWGAQGGNARNLEEARGGYGGYARGEITLDYGQVLFINVGGVGLSSATGGYNGGGTSITDGNTVWGSGGGSNIYFFCRWPFEKC